MVIIFRMMVYLALFSWTLFVLDLVYGVWAWPFALLAAVAFSMYAVMAIPFRFEIEDYYASKKARLK